MKKFNVLSEKVSGTDLFTDQTHKKITDTIYNFIKLNHDKGTSIGLEGSWGSGKTHILDMLKNKFIEDEQGDKKETYFFLFDGWAHKGDPLRKAFLDRLLNYCGRNTSDNGFINEIKNKVIKSIQVSNETSTSHYSFYGKLLGTTTVIAPLAAALLSKVNFAFPNSEESTGEIHVWATILMTITFLPILTIISGWIISIFKKDFNYIPFLSNPDKTLNKKIVISDEKTSFEFELYFQKTVEELIKNNDKFKRLIIAIDNLDRMDSVDASQLWTTLQTFFQHRNVSDDNEKWQKYIFFIVPFDREALQNIWFSNFEKNIGESESSPKNSRTDYLTKSFIEKNFEVIFEVPYPLVSQWYSLVDDFCKSAFKGWSTEDVEIIKSVFRFYSNILHGELSPRKIRSYINQVGVNWMRWSDESSLKIISIYSLLRLEFRSKEIKDMLATRSLTSNFNIYLSPDEEKEMSGIVCGVNKEKGLEVLLSEYIKEIFDKGDDIRMVEIIDTFEGIFPTIWNSISNSIFPSYGTTEEFVFGTTNALLKSSDKYREEDWFKSTVEKLREGWVNLLQTGKLDKPNLITSLELLVDIDDSHYLINEINKSLINLTNKTFSLMDKQNVDDQFIVISKLSILVREHDEEYKPVECQQLNLERFLKWQKISRRLEIESDIILPPKSVSDEMCKKIEKDSIVDDTLLDTLKFLLKLEYLNSKVDKIISLIEQKINSEQNKGRYYLILYILFVYGDELIKDKVRGIVKSSKFTESMKRNIDNADYKLTILVILCFGIGNFDEFKFKVFYLKFTSKEFNTSEIDDLLEELKLCNNLEIIWYLASQGNDRVGIWVIKNRLNENSSLLDVSNVKKYLSKIKQLKKSEIHLIEESTIMN